MSVLDGALQGVIERMERMERDRQWIRENDAVVAAELRRLREARGMTQRTIADQLGVSVVYISDMERGNRPVFTNTGRLSKWIAIVRGEAGQ